jgi:hypothetical protein
MAIVEPFAEELRKLKSVKPGTRCKPVGGGAGRRRAVRRRLGVEAAELGWRGEELFGLHPTVPLSRYDHMGLNWVLRGRPVRALTKDWADLGAGKFYRSEKRG